MQSSRYSPRVAGHDQVRDAHRDDHQVIGGGALADHAPLYRFTVATARGEEQDHVATLLRRVASALDDLGAVDVHDITFHVESTDQGPWPSMTVYYEVIDDEVVFTAPPSNAATTANGNGDAIDQRALRRLKELWRTTNHRRRVNGRH